MENKIKFNGRNYDTIEELTPKLVQAVEELRDKILEIHTRLAKIERNEADHANQD